MTEDPRDRILGAWHGDPLDLVTAADVLEWDDARRERVALWHGTETYFSEVWLRIADTVTTNERGRLDVDPTEADVTIETREDSTLVRATISHGGRVAAKLSEVSASPERAIEKLVDAARARGAIYLDGRR